MVALLSVKGAVQQGGSHPKGQSERGAGGADAGLIFAVLLFLFILLLLLLFFFFVTHSSFVSFALNVFGFSSPRPSSHLLPSPSRSLYLSSYFLARFPPPSDIVPPRPPDWSPTLVSLPHFNPPASL